MDAVVVENITDGTLPKNTIARNDYRYLLGIFRIGYRHLAGIVSVFSSYNISVFFRKGIPVFFTGLSPVLFLSISIVFQTTGSGRRSKRRRSSLKGGTAV